MALILYILHQVLKYKVQPRLFNDDLELILIFFNSKVKMLIQKISWEVLKILVKKKQSVYTVDLLNEYMKIRVYNWSRSF